MFAMNVAVTKFAVDRPSIDADASPQPRYRGLTLPKLRLGRVKMVAISEKCQINLIYSNYNFIREIVIMLSNAPSTDARPVRHVVKRRTLVR